MVKAMGVVVGVFGVGTISTVMLAPVLGPYAEHAALAVVGVGLVAASRALGFRLAGARRALPPEVLTSEAVGRKLAGVRRVTPAAAPNASPFGQELKPPV
ncbi:MAG: hypothetical protein ACYC8T_34410 [Myxococcaceae bacterium]